MRALRGFTFLEAIVALALLTMAIATVFGMLNTQLLTLHRIEDLAQRHRVIRAAVAYMEMVNPTATPSGEFELTGYTIGWESVVAEGPEQGVGYPLGESLFEMALYRTTVDIHKDGDIVESISMRLVGYKQVRSWRDADERENQR
jgi:hypothetical protein